MNPRFAVSIAIAVLIVIAPTVRAEDAKSGADNLKCSRDFYSEVHFVAIAKLTFEQGPPAEFK